MSERELLHIASISDEPARGPGRVLCLLYHELRAEPSQYSYVMDTRLFERHVEVFVRLRQAGHSGLWPEVTFDDGHISNFEYAAPILQSRRIAAHFFITVGWTGTKPGYMGWSELQALQQAGHSIGAHGWSHKLLTHCSDEELEAELRKARLTLEDKLGSSIKTMSLPGGRSDRRVLNACVLAGYSHVYTSVPRAERLPLGNTVGRLNILAEMQPEWIEELFHPNGELLAKLERKDRMKAVAKRLLGDRLYAKLWALVNRQEPDSEGPDSEVPGRDPA